MKFSAKEADAVGYRLKLRPSAVLALPRADAEYALVTDAAGRAVCTLRYDTLVALPPLAPGFYEVRTLNRKGVSHKVARFGTGFPFTNGDAH